MPEIQRQTFRFFLPIGKIITRCGYTEYKWLVIIHSLQMLFKRKFMK